MWVAVTGDDSVVRIDPTTNSVKTTIDVGEAPSAIAVGEHAVWVANSGDGTVSRIDPATNTVVETIDVGGSPAGIAVVRGLVWVTIQAAAPPTNAAARGGTARFDLSEDVQTDPALYPQQSDQQISYATCAKLLNYPDKPAPAGTRLVPEVARSLPTRSADGRTYTFTIRNGFAFSPPLRERVTAETFRHSIERAFDPRMHGAALAFADDIAGARAFASGKANHVSGVTVRGNRLSIALIRPAPSILARLAMPIFCAVPLNTPPSPQTAIPSAGPYYIASHVRNRQIVLKRNPNYHGPRPHRLDEIVYTIGIGFEERHPGRARPRRLRRRAVAERGRCAARGSVRAGERQAEVLPQPRARARIPRAEHAPAALLEPCACGAQSTTRSTGARSRGRAARSAGRERSRRSQPTTTCRRRCRGFRADEHLPARRRPSHRPPPDGRTPPHRRRLQLQHRAATSSAGGRHS